MGLARRVTAAFGMGLGFLDDIALPDRTESMAGQAPARVAQQRRLKWGAGLTAALCVAAGLALWIIPSQQSSGAPSNGSTELVTSRGYTDAPAGTALIAGDPWSGGAVLLELRVKNDQKVKRGEVIAVLSNYPQADVSVRTAEAELEKVERQRETMVSGYRATAISLQEIAVKTMAEQVKLKTLELTRSDGPPDVKQLQLEMARTNLERGQAMLRVMKESLATDLAEIDADLKASRSGLDNARTRREQALVRSPLDGIVVQVYARPGERIGPNGIVKIVDMKQMRVIADVDEQHMDRAHVGAKVEVTFRGSANTYPGKISRVLPIVRRMQRTEPDGGSTTDAPVVQVEIKLDNPADMPEILGREAKVTVL
ncbi:MAG: HlyD family efflux transporter periplasmic adaptor subunit [Proteobacteria bacterium]|nr:HlyD family efflux transporter periplasmic adaptor subunit [Pseudomonadota bacterium]